MMTRSEFTLRFYEWAQDDFQRELAEDFPLLSQVSDSAAVRVIHFIRALSPSLRSLAASGLVKRFHIDAVRILGTVTTGEEAELVSAVLNEPIPLPSFSRWSRSAMRKATDQEISPIFGLRSLPWHKDICELSETIGGLHIGTLIDVGSTINKLSYEHTVVFPEGDHFGRVSVLSWLGIAFETDWNLAEDPLSSAKGLRNVYAHFRNAMIAILAS